MHGFRVSRKKENLKFNKGYIIPSTKQEDASLIDFWVKMLWSRSLVPIQVTQRGDAILRQRNPLIQDDCLRDFVQASERRLSRKRRVCRKCRIAFAMIRDHLGDKPSRSVAWGDRKALHQAIQVLGEPLKRRVSVR